jgi:hypothetical protein
MFSISIITILSAPSHLWFSSICGSSLFILPCLSFHTAAAFDLIFCNESKFNFSIYIRKLYFNFTNKTSFSQPGEGKIQERMNGWMEGRTERVDVDNLMPLLVRFEPNFFISLLSIPHLPSITII